ncbi:MAG: lactate utilization protein [Deltaproteobacteria bacterium]|nr:lactate utilization protein [Deltaproteobacteria bacterium]
MFNAFKIRAEAVSSEVHRFPSKMEAMGFILEFLKKEGIEDSVGACALWAPGPFLEGFDTKRLTEIVPGLHFEVTRQRAAEAKIGISQMDFGLADTGTLVQDATAVEKRLVSTLPEIHLALLETGKIVPDLPAVLRLIDPRESAYLALITGPSRTADIERVLTIGVHGPVRVVIVCIDPEQEAA